MKNFKENVKDSFSKVKEDTHNLKNYVAYFANEQKGFNHSMHDRFTALETENIELKATVSDLKKEIKSAKASIKASIAKLKTDIKKVSVSQKVIKQDTKETKNEIDYMFDSVAELQVENEVKRIEDVVETKKESVSEAEKDADEIIESVTIVKKKVKVDSKKPAKESVVTVETKSVETKSDEITMGVKSIPNAVNPEIISPELQKFLESKA